MGAPGSAELRDFYEGEYSDKGEEGMLYGRWRALGARGKAAHVQRLAARLPAPPRTVVEVGCGDGVLLDTLAELGVGETHYGFEISDRAVAIARGRQRLAAVERFDGSSLPAADGAYDLGVLSHVLEHVPDPLPLLTETARVARAVVVEVPLEDNRSASRPSARRASEKIGHLHRLSRADVHELCASAGLSVLDELSDPLPLAVHAFFATTPAARAKAAAKAALRRSLFTASPALAERAFTVHYACLAAPS
jgi:SAM-dependent methyltransferase